MVAVADTMVELIDPIQTIAIHLGAQVNRLYMPTSRIRSSGAVKVAFRPVYVDVVDFALSTSALRISVLESLL